MSDNNDKRRRDGLLLEGNVERREEARREALARHSATFNCQTRVSRSLPARIHRMKHEMGVKKR